MPVKNYCYGAYAPVEKSAEVAEQMLLAHRYRNKLVELELNRRQKVNDLLRTFPEYAYHADVVAEAEANLEQAVQDIRSMRGRVRARVPASGRQATELDRARKHLKAVRKEFREVRKRTLALDACQEGLLNITAEHKEEFRAARAANGLYWGTYLTVEDAAKDFGKGPPPKFMRYRGDGTISVQMQNGLSVEDAMAGTDTRFKICQDYVRIRIGSTEDRKPIFAKFPIVLHRPLPPGGKIKWAHVHLTHIGPTPQWKLRLCIDAEWPERIPVVDRGAVAVHPGWRVTSAGLQVATVCWGRRNSEVSRLVLPKRELHWLDKASDLQSIRDKNMARAVEELSQWLKGSQGETWLTHDAANMGKWKSPARLHDLIMKWRHNRLELDEAIYASMEAWRKQDKHLWLWWAHGMAKQVRRRDHIYRCFAADLAKKHVNCVLPKIDLKALLEQEQVDEEVRQLPHHRRQARLAAVGTLMRFIKEAMPGRVVEVSPDGLSQECCFCSEPMNKPSARVGTCPECGKSSDVDVRAALNQLTRRGHAEHVGGKSPSKSGQLSKRQQAMRKNKKQPIA